MESTFVVYSDSASGGIFVVDPETGEFQPVLPARMARLNMSNPVTFCSLAAGV